jgi:PEP-CTERM motif
MKLTTRIFLLVLLGLSIAAHADTVRFFMNTDAEIDPNSGAGDNVAVTLSGQGVVISLAGGIPFDYYNFDEPIQPGSSVLGPTTIFWDFGFLKIGSQGYDFDNQFDAAPVFLDIPSFTLPTNGKDFSVTVPWVWELSGIIVDNCPSAGCVFDLVGKPGKITFTFFYLDGNYFGGPSSFTTVPEPGTLSLLGLGIAAALGRYRCRRAAGTKDS